MDVLRRDDDILAVVLEIHDPVQEVALVVIVNKDDGAGHLPALFPFLLDHLLPDEVPEGLGAVRVFFPADQPVEALKQAFLEGDAEAYDLGHDTSHSTVFSLRATDEGACQGGISRCAGPCYLICPIT